MDHKMAVREMMAERYLLKELSATEQDAFEEHFFDCPECGYDIRAGSTFITYSKNALAETAETAPAKISDRKATGHEKTSKGWLGWLNPAFAAPVLALLLIVVGYQNLVIYPKLRSAAQPQVLPWTSLAVGTWSGEKPSIAVNAGRGFLLFVRIPSNGTFAHYAADLYGPAGQLDSSLAIPAAPGQDEWPVLVAPANRSAGEYRMLVRGITSSGESKDIGSTLFELQIKP